MEKIKLFISTFVIAMLFVTVSCDTTEVVEETSYTYSVSKVSWSDPIDNDKDGYATNGVLTVFVNLEEDVTRNIDVRVYFLAAGGGAYSFYTSVNDIEFKGIDSPIPVQVMVGAPNRELIYGNYDFKIEIHESGSESIKATAEKGDTEIEGADQLGGQKFETLAADQIYDVKVHWENINDQNGNGYATDASLFVDVNIEQNLTKEVKVELYHKERSKSDYTLYASSPQYQINFDDSSDVYKFEIGTPPLELMMGIYDFKIIVYETGIYSPVAMLDSASIEPMADSLRGRKFETGNDDGYFYTIDTSRIFWTDRYDFNMNDYTVSRTLNLNVDVDKEESRQIWVQVYYKETDSVNYNFFNSYYEDSPWSINGGNDTNDIVSIAIGPLADTTKNLNKHNYDFLVNILEANNTFVVTSASDAESDSLRSQTFETAHQDSL